MDNCIQLDKDTSLDKCWKNLPLEISELICNNLPKVRRISDEMSHEIKAQWGKYATYYYTCARMFGFNNVYYVMYDDMRHITGIRDDFPEDTPYTMVVEQMWLRLTPEQRDELLMHY